MWLGVFETLKMYTSFYFLFCIFFFWACFSFSCQNFERGVSMAILFSLLSYMIFLITLSLFLTPLLNFFLSSLPLCLSTLYKLSLSSLCIHPSSAKWPYFKQWHHIANKWIQINLANTYRLPRTDNCALWNYPRSWEGRQTWIIQGPCLLVLQTKEVSHAHVTVPRAKGAMEVWSALGKERNKFFF